MIAAISLSAHECGHGWDFDSQAYQLSEGIPVPMSGADYFPRSEITADEFHGDIPGAVFSEWSQYNHDLAYMYMLQPHIPSGAFEVELVLNFAWAAPRYLEWARDNYPADYEAMLADRVVREADVGFVPGAQHTQSLDAIRNPTLLDTMNDLRAAHGCRGI